ncbi:MAG TPA: tetratricopeptide repeat protein [Polyangia bacterium]|nr:tetratricopeptide repeat protein [Polyangia bacterium]
MAGTTYGITFSRRLRDEGRYEEAVSEADQAARRDPSDPEPIYDRAAALYCLGRFEESVSAFARAIEVERTANLMEEAVLDDDLFETLRKWAEAEPARCRDILGRYAQLLPQGTHKADVAKWLKHIESDPRRK